MSRKRSGMARNSLLIVLLMLLYCPLPAQQNRYVVYLTDKNDTPFSLESPEAFLSERSLQRRIRQNISLNEQDLPVNPAYLEQIRAVTGEVYYPSKWLNAVLVQCTDEEIAQVEALAIVDEVEYVAQGIRLPEGGRYASKLETEGALAEFNSFQLEMHGIPELHAEGHKGEGMMVAIMDGGYSGVDTISALRHIFEEGRVLMEENIGLQSRTHFGISHGTNVFSIMAGLVPGEYQGIIPDAMYLLFDSEDPASEQRIEEYNWIIAAEKADSAGADVINTSLGYAIFDDEIWDYSYEDMDGESAMISIGAGWASARGMLVVVSAGNSGSSSWQFINAPADAIGILAVGAVNDALQPAGFSSFGPSFDGRIKPEVSSLGVQTVLIRADGSIATGNGTSFAAPVIAGFATALWQRYPDMTAAELRQYIISISSRVGNPDSQLGYGIPSVNNPVTSTDNFPVDFSAYPNPVIAGGQLRIRTSEQVTALWQISPDGRMTRLEFTSADGEIIIEMSDIPGLYILRVETAGTNRMFKIINY